jgi:shikimate 5-dehydrogenase
MPLPNAIGFMDVNYGGKRELTIPNAIVKKGSTITEYSGLDMLIWQAIEQNRHFCQDDPESVDIQNEYFRVLRSLVGS